MGNPNGRGSIGYKRPPAHSRFAKGKSGNPKGRPKGKGVGNALANLINQHVTVTVDGAPRKMLLTEALVTSLAQRALAGNMVAAREFMKIAEKVSVEQKAIEEKSERIDGFRHVIVDPKECNVPLEKLGVIEEVADCWRIRTWVVEAAMARNRQLVLNGDDRQLLANSMVDAVALQPILLQLG